MGQPEKKKKKNPGSGTGEPQPSTSGAAVGGAKTVKKNGNNRKRRFDSEPESSGVITRASAASKRARGRPSRAISDKQANGAPPEPDLLQELADRIKSGAIKKIVVIAGAGISTSAGVPDFRSPGEFLSFWPNEAGWL